jgi:deazaflavin-dependent oxidoreductase (nitroreductase family)
MGLGDWAIARTGSHVAGNARMSFMAEHYQRPGWFTTNVFNRIVAALTAVGISVYGSRVLEVKGRKSGEWRQTPVNLLRYEGADYLVAPRGHTQWVKNLRASGHGRLRVGRRTEAFTAVETLRRGEATATAVLSEKVEVRGGHLLRRGGARILRR